MLIRHVGELQDSCQHGICARQAQDQRSIALATDGATFCCAIRVQGDGRLHSLCANKGCDHTPNAVAAIMGATRAVGMDIARQYLHNHKIGNNPNACPEGPRDAYH